MLEDFAAAAAAYRRAGNDEAAKEMDGYAQNRLDWAKAKDDCIEKQTVLEKLLADSTGLEHTREYQELQQDLAATISACEPYFTS